MPIAPNALIASTDEELMTAYGRGGDAAAFAELYRRYESRLFGFLVRRLSSMQRPVVEDLFQKTWLKVHQARDRFRSEERFSPWVFSIAMNALRDEWRLLSTRKELFDDEEHDSVQGLQDPADDAEEKLSLKEDLSRLDAALVTLPDAQREALLLSDWEGFSSIEVAKILKVSDAAARQLVSRARKRVRSALGGGSDGRQ